MVVKRDLGSKDLITSRISKNRDFYEEDQGFSRAMDDCSKNQGFDEAGED